jgi:hypothetical protein
MSVYVAYSDETGTPNSNGAFVVGGYVAAENDWPEFSKNWANDVLHSLPPIPYLHMVELRGKKFRQEHKLTWEDALKKTSVAVETIKVHNFIRRYFGTINRGKLQEIQAQIEQSGFKYRPHHSDPDYMCFLSFAWVLIQDLASNQPDVSRINFMVSKKKHVTHYYAKFRDELRNFFLDYSPQLAPLVGDLLPVSMCDHMPLQAADCFLWHVQRAYSKNLESEDDKNLKLLESTGGLGKEWTADELEVFANGLSKKK